MLVGWLVLDTVLVALLKVAAIPEDCVETVAIEPVAPEPKETPPAAEAVAVVAAILPSPEEVEIDVEVTLVDIPPNENPVLGVLVALKDVALEVFEAVVTPSVSPRPTAGVLFAVIGATAATEAIGVPRVRLPPGLAANPKPVGAEVEV